MKIYKIAERRKDSEGQPINFKDDYFLKLKWKHIKNMNDPYFFGGGSIHAPEFVMLPKDAVIIKGVKLLEMAYDWTMMWDAIKAR
jgi:hypothetical protein